MAERGAALSDRACDATALALGLVDGVDEREELTAPALLDVGALVARTDVVICDQPGERRGSLPGGIVSWSRTRPSRPLIASSPPPSRWR